MKKRWRIGNVIQTRNRHLNDRLFACVDLNYDICNKQWNGITLTLRQAWNGNCSSDPLMTMLGKSSKWTSSGSNMPFLVTIICLGCSSTGSDL